MRKSKKLIALLLTSAFVFAQPVVSLADTVDNSVIYSTSGYETLPANYSGNATNLIFVKNPASLVSSTTTKSYVISAVAQSGTNVALYAYNSAEGRYEKLYTEGGVAMQSTVGASGLYAQSVNLNSGKNTIMVVASGAGGTEVIKLDITLNQGFVNKIKSFTVGISQIFK